MRPVPNPVHKAKSYVVYNIFIHMVFHQNKRTGHTSGLAEQHRGVLCVMKHIHQKANFKRTICKRE